MKGGREKKSRSVPKSRKTMEYARALTAEELAQREEARRNIRLKAFSKLTIGTLLGFNYVGRDSNDGFKTTYVFGLVLGWGDCKKSTLTYYKEEPFDPRRLWAHVLLSNGIIEQYAFSFVTDKLLAGVS